MFDVCHYLCCVAVSLIVVRPGSVGRLRVESGSALFVSPKPGKKLRYSVRVNCQPTGFSLVGYSLLYDVRFVLTSCLVSLM